MKIAYHPIWAKGSPLTKEKKFLVEKFFFCHWTQNRSFKDPIGRSENQNFFFFTSFRSLKNNYFRRKNLKISLKIDKIIEFLRNRRNLQFWSIFDIWAHRKVNTKNHYRKIKITTSGVKWVNWNFSLRDILYLIPGKF